MADVESTRRGVAEAAAVFSVIVGFTAGPLLRFAPTIWLAWGGIIFAMGIAGVWLAAHFSDSDDKSFSTSEKMVIVVAVVGFFTILWSEYEAWMASAAQDVRCAHIQREMLLPHPRRSDLSSMFEALGCRPQGDDDVQFPGTVAPSVPITAPTHAPVARRPSPAPLATAKLPR